MKKSIVAVLVAVAALMLFSTSALAAEKGDVVQADNLGMNMISWNLTKGTNTTVSDQQTLSEFTGLHYYITDRVRLGAMLQFSEVLNPTPKYDRFSKFAILPQVGWNFWGPLYMAGIVTIAPRTQGGDNMVLGVQYLLGASVPVSKVVRLNAALEVPWDFYNATGKNQQVVGLTPLVGVSFKL